jgi:ABC-type nitrate/sulfonate/bicarbonate transport system ATPase subunit
LEGPFVAEPISVFSLTKTYPGAAIAALKSVSLDVAPGTFLVLLGPSGSGKTTLLRCLAGIERIDSGSVAIGARVVADGRSHVPPEQRDLSMVFQDYALWPHMTALDNVAFALRRRHLPRSECRARAAAMLDRVGLAEFGKRYPNELSGGQQQRVALARALIADTGLILCDEPLSNLDADLRERMRVEISALVREAGATTGPDYQRLLLGFGGSKGTNRPGFCPERSTSSPARDRSHRRRPGLWGACPPQPILNPSHRAGAARSWRRPHRRGHGGRAAPHDRGVQGGRPPAGRKVQGVVPRK